VASPKAYHHGNLRQVLIETGLKLIEEKGVQALTLREIGDRIGVSRMAPYRHFADKAALVAAICVEGFTRFADDLDNAKKLARPDFASRMTAMGVAYVRFATEHPAYFEVMFGPFANPADAEPGEGPGERAFGLLEETIREGQASGDVQPGDSQVLALVAWALVHGVSALRLEGSGAGNALTKFACGILQEGLRPTASARKSGDSRPLADR
jgi:AcrR family transcriptional regulator